MNKSLLSALGLAVALAMSMPVVSNAAATTTAAPAATTTAPAAAMKSDAMSKKKPMKHAMKTCKATKKHKCPVMHKKHTMKPMAKKA